MVYKGQREKGTKKQEIYRKNEKLGKNYKKLIIKIYTLVGAILSSHMQDG